MSPRIAQRPAAPPRIPGMLLAASGPEPAEDQFDSTNREKASGARHAIPAQAGRTAATASEKTAPRPDPSRSAASAASRAVTTTKSTRSFSGYRRGIEDE